MTDWEKIEPPPAPQKTTPARMLPGRFPLLWVLLPLSLAYALSEGGLRLPHPASWAVAVTATTVAIVGAFGGNSRRMSIAFSAAFPLGVFCAGLLWHDLNRPPGPDRAALPPREAVLSVRVDELFNSRFETISGLGRIVGTGPHLDELNGARIQFRVTKHTGDPGFDLGGTVRLRGVLDNAPAGEGFARYLSRRGVRLTLSRARLEAVEVPASEFRLACTRARERTAVALSRGVGPEDAARLSALMLGRTSLLPPSEREDFRKAGATHLFAISGLHITGIAAGLLWASRRARIHEATATLAVLGALWLYVQMAGAPPSAVRAWLMAAAMFGAAVIGRGARPAAGLIFAATFSLIAEPALLRDPGFLLSHLVVAAIIFYAVPLSRALEAGWRPWRFVPAESLGMFRRTVLRARRPVFAAVATSWAATLAGAPLVAALFGNASPVGLVANLAMVPLSGPPVILGFIAGGLGMAGIPELAAPFNKAGAFFMELLARGAHLAACVPGGSWETGSAPDRAPAIAGFAVLAALVAAPPRPDRPAWRYAILPGAAMGAFLACVG